MKDFTRIVRDGRPMWLHTSGHVLPVIAGGSDGGTEGGGEGDGGKGGEGGDGFKPITSQDDLNRVIADRISRERAKFSDYEDLKAKAAKLDELDEANKSEVQKAVDAAAKAETRAEKAEAEALRLRVAAKHGISDPDDIDLFLTGTDEETLTKQAERLAGRSSDRKKNGNHVPREGTTTTSKPDEVREFTRNLFGKAD